MNLLLLLFVLANAADLWTTITNLSLGCSELNPLYQGSTLHIVTVKGLVVALLTALVTGLDRRGYFRYARIVIWTGIIAAFGAATWNLSIMPYCGR